MEYLEGETLAAARTVLKYGIETCEGLERAHRGGVVHRDLKPANIMLTKSGEAVGLRSGETDDRCYGSGFIVAFAGNDVTAADSRRNDHGDLPVHVAGAVGGQGC